MGAGSLSYISIIVFAVALSTGSVFAVDHGASCCGDLEERIAELEATTATKGNRKMSLTISGQVNRLIMWWDDGRSSNTYYGIESTPFSSRFDFTGKARITPKVNAGFQLTIDSRAGGYSGGLSQLDEDGKFSALVPNVNTGSTGPIGLPSFNAPDSGSYFANGRRIFWWIEQEDIGRLSIGRTDLPGLFATIDMTGGQLYLVAGDPSFINGSFYIRGPAGQYYAMVWGFIIDAAQGSTGPSSSVMTARLGTASSTQPVSPRPETIGAPWFAMRENTQASGSRHRSAMSGSPMWPRRE